MRDPLITVVFDKDTGKIKRMGPSLKVENSIEVPLSKIIGLKNGTDNRLDYKVKYDVQQRKYTIVKRRKITTVTALELLYEIPYSSEAELQIIQNCAKKQWQIKLDSTLRKTLKENNLNTDQTVFFSITDVGDVNVLYKYFSIQMSELINSEVVELDFTMPFEQDKTEVSIFTRKIFNSYGYEVINEI